MGRAIRGLLHLLLGGAAAGAIVGLGVAVALAAGHSSGIGRWLVVAIGAAALGLVLWLLTAPVVRPVAAHLVRLLLGADVPELAESDDRQARLEGLVWALIVLLVGGGCLAFLLVGLPSAVSLVLSGGWGGPVLGALLAVAALAVQPLGISLLRCWAPAWLRPSSGELLAAERERGDRLARSNAVARDLHDSIGHALTAIGVQAEAALVTGRTDSVGVIRDLANDAVADLDRVLGVLRERSDDAARPGDLRAIPGNFPAGAVELTTSGIGAVAPAVAEATYRIVQESVTNGVRHGVLPVRAQIETAGDGVRITVVNAVDADRSVGPHGRGGRGLIGMRERAVAVGGTLTTALEDESWWVRAQLPLEGE